MADIGLALALEQLPPRASVELAMAAEEAGFCGVMASDVLSPWLPSHANAPFVWNVLTAIAERTRGMVGTGVAVPAFRTHPLRLAQAAATMAAMYPGRHWLGVGAGEAINEHAYGGYWPEPAQRISMMFEAIDLIKKLFANSAAGKDTKYSGNHFSMESARLWTMPASPPAIVVATGGPVTAKRAGRHADGIITFGHRFDKVATLFDRARAGAREAGKDPDQLQLIVQLHTAWAATEAEALAAAQLHWPMPAMRFSHADIRSPFEVARMAKLVRPEDIRAAMVVSADPADHASQIQRYLDLGATAIYVHNAGVPTREWVDFFGRDVLEKVVS